MAFTTPAVPPGNLKYCRPNEIITSQAVWTAVAGNVSTDPDYDLTALYDGKMSKPCKFIDEPIAAIRIVGDYGSARRIDGMALPNSNIPAGTVMRAELNATNVWTAPTVSVNVTMGAHGLDGHVASPWADFTTASGYSVGGFRYCSWYVPVTAYQPWLGELLVMQQLRSFSQWTQFGGTRSTFRPFLENLMTEYGVTRVVRRLIKQRQFEFQLKGNEQDFTDLQLLCDASGGMAIPFFMVADSNIKTDGGLYGRFTPETAAMIMGTEEWFDLNSLTIAFKEDSRSLPLFGFA
jgi:hypothetical protein